MKNVWVRWSGLALLDDNAADVYTARLGESLSRSISHRPPAQQAAPAAAPSHAAPLSRNAMALGAKHAAPTARAQTQPPASKKVFTSSPSLRQMMSDYNRPISRLAPIKTTVAQPKAAGSEFEFDEIDFIQLANIPGRILRPSST